MTEYSYFWVDSALGHGALQPYTSDVMDQIADLMSSYDNSIQGVIKGYLNELVCSNPSGSVIRVASGGAIVAGSLYINDDNVDTTLTLNGYYVFVLRKDWATQTVRVAYLYDASAYPVLTHNWGVTWEIELLHVRRNAGFIVSPIVDVREYVRNELGQLRIISRSGSVADKNWNYPMATRGAAFIAPKQKGRTQAGCVNWNGVAAVSGSVSENFAVPFSYKPIAIVTPMNNHGNVNATVEVSETAITIYWHSGDATTYTTLDFQYFVVGPIERGY